ncbi:MAG TPA: type VI secretion system baseplate subunit TssK [Gemmatirosa sp.]
MRASPLPPTSARVVWEEGMYLAPHHFQAQRRHVEDGVAGAIAALFPFAWGVSSVALDTEALANGTLAVTRARGILPDGTPFNVPDADTAPPPLALAAHFSPARDAQLVHLVLPPWRRDGANVADPDALVEGEATPFERSDRGAPRYVAVPREVVDEASGRDAAPVRFAAKNLALALDDALPEEAVHLPLARVRRDGAGRFVEDDTFVPPALTYAASARLVALLGAVVGMLDAKGAALAATLPQLGVGPDAAAAGPSAYAGNEVATRWLLYAVRSADAPLRHLQAIRHAHPEQLWRELSRLAGALCTFSLTTSPRDLPVYAHDDLAGCFGALERHLRTHLDVVVASSAVVVPLARTSDVLHTATVVDPRCFAPGARWFLGATAALAPAEVAARVPRLVKVCAEKYVLELVRRAYPGLAVHHTPAPPAELAPRPGVSYFELTIAGPCGQGLQETREIGVYVPDGLPDAALQLVVLVPG